MVLGVLAPDPRYYYDYYVPKVQSRFYRPGGEALSGTMRCPGRINFARSSSIILTTTIIIISNASRQSTAME